MPGRPSWKSSPPVPENACGIRRPGRASRGRHLLPGRADEGPRARRQREPSMRALFRAERHRPSPGQGSDAQGQRLRRAFQAALDAFFRVKLRGNFHDSTEALQADLDARAIHCNTERPHPGYRNMAKDPPKPSCRSFAEMVGWIDAAIKLEIGQICEGRDRKTVRTYTVRITNARPAPYLAHKISRGSESIENS